METFVVRIWTSGEDGWSPGVRGTASHLASGKHVTFTEAAALIEFLSDAAEPNPQHEADEARSAEPEYQSHTSLTHAPTTPQTGSQENQA
jgi:hypothetical protein